MVYCTMRKTTVYLTDELQRGLKELAHRSGRPEADLLREALRAYLAQQTRPQPLSLGAGQDLELSARESEAWLRTQWGAH